MSWWPFRSSPQKQSFVEDYLQQVSSPIPSIRKIMQLDFVILDTETTGLDPNRDHILSFGAIRIQQGKIKVKTAVEYYPETSRDFGATAKIHGLIKRENLLHPEAFTQNLLTYIGPSILVGHHVSFDLEMLLKIARPFGLTSFPNPSIDTLDLAVRLEYGPNANWNEIPMKDYSLEALCQRYHIPIDDRHTAGGDTFLTAQLLLKLLKIAEKKEIDTFGKLIR